MRRLLVLTLLLLAVAMLAGGCRKVLSEDVLEASGAAMMSELGGTAVEVDCPGGITMRAQEDFFCRTRVADRRGWLLVRQLDDYGRIEFEREEPLERELIEGMVARYLARQYDLDDAQVRCPGAVIQEPDENFRCTVRGEAPVDVRQVDGVDEYAINWRGAASTGGRE